MTLEDLRNLFAYDDWANERMMTCAGELSEALQEQPLVSSFPTVAATIAHIVGAEWVWLRRFCGESPTRPEEWITTPSLPRLRERLDEIESERRVMLGGFDEGRLTDVLEYRNMAGEQKQGRYGDLMLHVVNHSTYHRGQLTTMLRQLGATPPATDLMLFNGVRSRV